MLSAAHSAAPHCPAAAPRCSLCKEERQTSDRRCPVEGCHVKRGHVCTCGHDSQVQKLFGAIPPRPMCTRRRRRPVNWSRGGSHLPTMQGAQSDSPSQGRSPRGPGGRGGRRARWRWRCSPEPRRRRMSRGAGWTECLSFPLCFPFVCFNFSREIGRRRSGSLAMTRSGWRQDMVM